MSKLNREKRRQHRETAMSVHKLQALVNRTRGAQSPYFDHDPSVIVQAELTGSESDYCIRLVIGDIKMQIHTRTAIDLSQKLQKAICDWIAMASAEALMNKGGDTDD